MIDPAVNVVCASDNNYAPMLSIVMSSLARNTDAVVRLNILDCGVTADNRLRLSEFSEYFHNLNLRWISVDLDDKMSTFPERFHITRAAYARLLIPEVLPDFKRVVYLDTDVMVCGDVRELFDEDLEEFAIGAVWEDYMEENGNNAEHLRRLKMNNGHKYFNSGVLLLDLDKWRRDRVFNKIMDMAPYMINDLKFMDQDLLNKYFECNYKLLPEKYNVTAPRARKHYRNGRLCECIVRHFEGGKKPWLVHPLIPDIKKSNYIGKRMYWDFVRGTPFYEELIARFAIYKFVDGICYRTKIKYP